MMKNYDESVAIDHFPDTAAIFVYVFLAKDRWMSRGHFLHAYIFLMYSLKFQLSG